MSNEMLPDSATLYNYAGEDAEGYAQYHRTLLMPCRVTLSVGTRLEKEGDNIKAYLFDAATVASNGETEKSYCDPRAYDTLTDKRAHWTLRDDGHDWIAMGNVSGETPPKDGTAYAIRTVKRNTAGSPALRHWKVTGR